jgi:hypothetical protein
MMGFANIEYGLLSQRTLKSSWYIRAYIVKGVEYVGGKIRNGIMSMYLGVFG